jgi:hypothetical protein
MASRNIGHQKKTPLAVKEYNQAIKRQRSDSTVEKRLDFNDTVKAEAEGGFVEPSSGSRINYKMQFIAYIKENWVQGLVSLFVIIGLYFIVESKIQMARIEEHNVYVDKQIGKIESDVKELDEQNKKQGIDIQDQKTKIDIFYMKK